MKKLFFLENKAAKDLKGNSGKWQLPLLIFLLLLLPVMAGIQHHNLGKLREVKQVSLKKSLERMAENFLTDFDNEWKNIQQTFSFDEDSSTGFESRFNQTYQTWKQTTSFPGLIKDIYFLYLQNEKPIISIFDVQKEIFSPIDWPAEPGEKRYIFTRKEESKDMVYGFLEPPISDKCPIIFSQCRNCNVNRENLSPAMILNFVIIVLDPDAVRNNILPNLIEKHFPAQNDFRLDIAIAKGNRPDDVLYIYDPDLDIMHFNKAEVRNEIRRWANFYR